MQWTLGKADLVLEFDLPSGGYATSVLRELVTVDRLPEETE
jgi:tRNA(Glu) U13 pseudouridine synthase TruD